MFGNSLKTFRYVTAPPKLETGLQNGDQRSKSTLEKMWFFILRKAWMGSWSYISFTMYKKRSLASVEKIYCPIIWNEAYTENIIVNKSSSLFVRAVPDFGKIYEYARIDCNLLRSTRMRWRKNRKGAYKLQKNITTRIFNEFA